MISISIATASPSFGAPTLCSWLPFETLARLPEMLKTVKRAFWKQRYCAGTRRIAWRFTLPTSWTSWAQSGRWSQRGQGMGKFCMAPNGDTGPYSPTNVRIITHEANVLERSAKRHRNACRRRSRRTDWLRNTRAASDRRRVHREVSP